MKLLWYEIFRINVNNLLRVRFWIIIFKDNLRIFGLCSVDEIGKFN